MAPLRERLLNQQRGGNADMPIEIESQDSQEEEEEPVGAAVAEEENDDEAAMEEEEEMAAAAAEEEAAAAKAAPISEDAVWEVRLAGGVYSLLSGRDCSDRACVRQRRRKRPRAGGQERGAAQSVAICAACEERVAAAVQGEGGAPARRGCNIRQ